MRRTDAFATTRDDDDDDDDGENMRWNRILIRGGGARHEFMRNESDYSGDLPADHNKGLHGDVQREPGLPESLANNLGGYSDWG